MNGATQLREHNAANEIASLGGSADFVAYDKAGNLPSPRLRQAGMTVVPQLPLPGYSPGYFLCTYDAWNRLTGVYTDSRSGGGTLGEYDSTDTPVALYEYDGLNRRTTKLVHDDAHGDWDRTDYYYDREWRVIEERLERDLSGGAELLPAESVYAEYVWDPHYVDAPAARFRDADGYTDDNENGVIDPAEQGDGTREEALFYVTDANHNVTAVVNADGKVVERYVYDAYGRPHVVNGDLTVDLDGLGPQSLDEWTLDPDNRSDVLNEILFSGTRLDTETNFHQVRHRYYHNTLGRWLGPDPIGYPDGMNYYEYCRSGPISATDPMGTETDDSSSIPSLTVRPQRSWIEKAWIDLEVWARRTWECDPANTAQDNPYTIEGALLHRILKPTGRGIGNVVSDVRGWVEDPLGSATGLTEGLATAGEVLVFVVPAAWDSERRTQMSVLAEEMKGQWDSLGHTRQGDLLLESGVTCYVYLVTAKAANGVARMRKLSALAKSHGLTKTAAPSLVMRYMEMDQAAALGRNMVVLNALDAGNHGKSVARNSAGQLIDAKTGR